MATRARPGPGGHNRAARARPATPNTVSKLPHDPPVRRKLGRGCPSTRGVAAHPSRGLIAALACRHPCGQTATPQLRPRAAGSHGRFAPQLRNPSRGRPPRAQAARGNPFG
eukprot:9195999-Lingulodinium_polyedra.AAC.1